MRSLLIALAGLCVALAPAGAAPPGATVSTPVIAPPAPPAPSKPRIPPTAAAADELARLYSAPDLTVPAEVRIFREKFPGMIRQMPNYDEFAKVSPTFAEDLARAVEPAMVRYVERTSIQFQREAARLFLDRLSASDVVGLTAFYNSAAGRRMLVMMVANANPDALIDKALKGEDFTTGDTRRQIADAARKTTGQMTPDEQAAMVRFMRLPAFWALARISPQLNKIKVDIINSPDPKFEEEMVAAMSDLMERSATSKTG